MDYDQDIFFKMQQQQMPGKQPFNMTNPIQNLYMTELEYQRDLDRMKEMYPMEIRKVQELVEEECDKMEYEGSLMFDEYPDRLMLRQICKRIRDKAGLGENREDMDAPEILLFFPVKLKFRAIPAAAWIRRGCLTSRMVPKSPLPSRLIRASASRRSCWTEKMSPHR